MRVFWTILALTGGLVLLVLLGAAIAVWTIDVNQFVGPIQKSVKDATGRDLAIGGGIDLKLGLEPKLVVNDIRVGNATWAKAPQLLTAKRVEAEIALLPLLRRRFELVRLNLVEPVIALESDGRGKGNWEFGTAAGSATGSPSGAVAALASFGIANVEVTNGTLTYRDGASGSVTHVDIDRFAAQARDPQSPINAEFRGKVENVPVAVSGNLGPLDVLLQRRAPYSISVQGEVDGQPANVATRMRVVEGAVTFDEIDLGLGSSKAKGEVNIATGGPRPKLTLRLAWPTLALADLRLARGTGAAVAKAAVTTKRSAYLFDDEPVSLAVPRSLDVDGDLSVGELKLPDGRHLDQVRARFTVKEGRLDAPELRAAAFGGTVEAALKIDATRAADPAIALSMNAKGLDLAALLAAAGMPREVRGGKTDIAIHVTTHGASPRQWARDVNGTAQAVVGPATLVNVKFDRESALNRLAQAVNPFRDTTPSTELGCAVVRLPLHDGVARIDRTIALETRELGVAASGTLDFRNETLDLAIMPRARAGLPIDVPQIADLVRFRGPFTAPAVTVDTAASVATIARIGAAIGTGGLSAVGAALLAPAASGGAGPCAVALGRAPGAVAATTGTSTARSPATPAEDLAKTLGRLLGR